MAEHAPDARHRPQCRRCGADLPAVAKACTRCGLLTADKDFQANCVAVGTPEALASLARTRTDPKARKIPWLIVALLVALAGATLLYARWTAPPDVPAPPTTTEQPGPSAEATALSADQRQTTDKKSGRQPGPPTRRGGPGHRPGAR